MNWGSWFAASFKRTWHSIRKCLSKSLLIRQRQGGRANHNGAHFRNPSYSSSQVLQLPHACRHIWWKTCQDNHHQPSNTGSCLIINARQLPAQSCFAPTRRHKVLQLGFPTTGTSCILWRCPSPDIPQAILSSEPGRSQFKFLQDGSNTTEVLYKVSVEQNALKTFTKGIGSHSFQVLPLSLRNGPLSQLTIFGLATVTGCSNSAIFFQVTWFRMRTWIKRQQ